MIIKLLKKEIYSEFLINCSRFNSNEFLKENEGNLDIDLVSTDKIESLLDKAQKIEVRNNDPISYLAGFVIEEKEFSYGEDNIFFVQGNFKTSITFYCYEIIGGSLSPKNSFVDYAISDNTLILYKRTIFNLRPPKNISGKAIFVPSSKSTKSFVDYLIHDLKQPYSIYQLFGIFLYTEEDVDLSKYLRNNFNSIDYLTGSDLDIRFIEEPYLLNGIDVKSYWRSILNSQLYRLMQFVGYTNTKPYNKNKLYTIIKKYNIDLSILPSLLIIKDMAKEEYILLNIESDITNLLRKVIDGLKNTKKHLEELKEVEIKKLLLTLPIIETFEITAPEGSKKRIEQWKKLNGFIHKQRADGKVTRSSAKNVAEKMYDNTHFEHKTFSYFKKVFEQNFYQKTKSDNKSGIIFFSYAWEDEKEIGKNREEIINSLYNTLERKKYTLRRDKMDLSYRGLISDFMQEIGKGNLIVVALSEKYLKSPYCMFELYEIYRNSRLDKNEFSDKIFPIHLETINLNDPLVLDEYYTHWEEKEEEWSKLIQKRMDRIGKEQFAEFDKVKQISSKFGDLASFIMDMNALTPDMLSENNFDKMITAINVKLNEN